MKEKEIEWHGNSFKDLKSFPSVIARQAGHQLRKVQRGLEPANWKPMPIIGSGAIELIVNDEDGWFRVVYVAKFEDTIHVLHSFQKKTNTTNKSDIDLAKKRYKEIGR